MAKLKESVFAVGVAGLYMFLVFGCLIFAEGVT